MSLKYRRKRIPVSRFRNVLIIICQILILTACSFILTKPVIAGEKNKSNEKVFIIDASASMLVAYDGETRFERAVVQVQNEMRKTMEEDGVVSVILANEAPYFLATRSERVDLSVIGDKLNALVDPDDFQCTYASADVEKAVDLAQSVVEQNPKANVFFYTATTYVDKGNIEVVDVGDENNDWNVAILDCAATMEDDNFYSISVKVGCYNRAELVKVYCKIEGVNGDYGTTWAVLESDELFFSPVEPEQTVVFDRAEICRQLGLDSEREGLYAFESLYVYVDATDGLADDNSLYVYGGIKDEVKIQYASTIPNNFFSGAIYTIREVFKNVWDIDFDEVTIEPNASKPEYATEGYDLYIFEHSMPDKMPDDGIVLLVDPDRAPKGSGLNLASNPTYVRKTSTLTADDAHPLLDYISPERITISKYRDVVSANGYETLMYYGNSKNEILLAKNEPDAKVVVLTLDLNYSNFGVAYDFPVFLYNIFNYFMPPTLLDYTYEVGDTVTLNSRGSDLTVTGGNIVDGLPVSEFPYQLVVTQPGTYTLTQVSIAGEYIIENFYVGISNYESDITKEVGALPVLYAEERKEMVDKDLLIYFAAVLVALLFAEWMLQAKEYF